jgi:chemotaxis protein methyltransferase CheR
MPLISQQDFEKLCQFIYRKTGIQISNTKYTTFGNKIEKMMIKNGLESFREFFHLLRFGDGTNLLQELINSITINETYFYREKYQFDVLVNKVFYELHESKPAGEPFRVLCAPSSTGEEPYSIALQLLAENNIVHKRDIEIVGIDIDTDVIRRAQNGIFSKRSVQMIPPKILNDFFEKKSDDIFHIAPFLTEAVEFRVANVMDKTAMKSLGKFDAIFSRNMLIYFDDASKRECCVTFYEMLNQKGWLFLGHADNINRATSLFTTVKYGDALVYRRG